MGAATPVAAGGGEIPEEQLNKIIEDSAAQIQAIAEARDRNVEFYVEAVTEGRSEPASTALEEGAVDLIAESQPQLLREIDGQTVQVGGGDEVTLATAGASPVDFEMSMVRQLLQAVASPQVAVTLLSIGTLALIYELANPGAIIPGVVGAIFLLIGLLSLNQLPVNIVGIVLLVLALGLFVAELFVPGIGVFAGGGAIALIAAGMFLFDEPTGIGVDLTFLIPVALAVAVVVVFLGRVTWRSLRTQAYEGPTGEFQGTVTEVRDVDGQSAWIWYQGSRWRAKRTDGGELSLGQRVRIRDIDGLTVLVEPAEDAEASSAG
jgi:membrane-bound serine protease (ClpP class)